MRRSNRRVTIAFRDRRFHQSLARARALGFDDRFIRMWDLYLAYCEARTTPRAEADRESAA
jgi:cyclopropane fatty-acyl-phospholipid synthase-like methyltransferase